MFLSPMMLVLDPIMRMASSINFGITKQLEPNIDASFTNGITTGHVSKQSDASTWVVIPR